MRCSGRAASDIAVQYIAGRRHKNHPPPKVVTHQNPERSSKVRRQFQGTINITLTDSKGDWDAFLADRAPAGAPNVLIILYDDTGQAAWSPYGGRINMPTLDKLAANGLTYTQWHTTALCSPTRSCFLTGRNHHQNGFASISETALAFPGYSSHIPP